MFISDASRVQLPAKAGVVLVRAFLEQFRTDECTERDSPVEASLDLPSDRELGRSLESAAANTTT